MSRPPRPAAQAGFTIAELMVGATLALLLLGAMLRLYLQTSDSLRLHTAQSRIQESGRFAGYFLARIIRPAGYVGDPGADPAELYPAASPALSGNDALDSAGLLAGSDSLTLRTQGSADGLNVNCAGAAIPAGSIAVMTLYLDSDGQLLCEDSANPGTTAPRLLLEQVRDLQLRYGVDPAPDDGQPSISRYRTAAEVADFDHVRAVRLAVTIGSALPSIDLTRRFDFTVSLRNRS